MAALTRPKEATYEIHEDITADTNDREDHTFCGIMFPVKCKDVLPLDRIVIRSVAVRGRLGPLTVWVSKDPLSSSNPRVPLTPQHWTCLYKRTHKPNLTTYTTLTLDSPIVLRPGQVKAVYIHSTLPGDEAIVYDNSNMWLGARGAVERRYEDDCLQILTGRAHVSTTVFGDTPIWGWGSAWRDRREFVGQVQYGIVYKLWDIGHHLEFGSQFQKMTRLLLQCQRRWESPWSMLPDDCIYYILNMCRWDWFDDTHAGIKTEQRARRLRASITAASEAASVALAAMPDAEASHQVAHAHTCAAKNQDNTWGEQEVEDVMDHNDDDDDDDDDDEGEEEWNEDQESIDVSEEEDDDSDWEVQRGYRADRNYFTYQDVDSDDDEEDAEVEEVDDQHLWFRRHFTRIHVMRALAAATHQG